MVARAWGHEPVAVIGLGYVGLPLALSFARKLRVLGFDVSESRVKALNSGRSYIDDIPQEDLAAAKANFTATSDPARLAEANTYVICVPTPLRDNLEPDLSFVVAAGEAIRPHLRPGKAVVLESTTFPGTTEGVLAPLLNESGLEAGKDYALAFSPERIDPGNKSFNVRNTPKLVGGIDEESTRRIADLYRYAVESDVVEVDSPRTAEASKILENIFRNVNIALVNEMALVFESMGIDVWKVIQAASTKPFAFMPHWPGPGVGGHCIPLDPLYLSYQAKRFGSIPRFIELSAEINDFMKFHAANLVEQAASANGATIRGSNVTILGIAYKRDVSDTRESPTEKLIELLSDRGAHIRLHDPHAASIEVRGKVWEAGKDLAASVAGANGVVLATDHQAYRTMDVAAWKKVAAGMAPHAFLVDLRNAVTAEVAAKAGLRYVGLGKPQSAVRPF